jgi:hypothetical protein
MYNKVRMPEFRGTIMDFHIRKIDHQCHLARFMSVFRLQQVFNNEGRKNAGRAKLRACVCVRVCVSVCEGRKNAGRAKVRACMCVCVCVHV